MKTLIAEIIKTAGSQTITYKGSPLTVSWGGEYYTAIHNGKVFRQTGMADLKKDIINNWVYDDFGSDNDLAELTVKQDKNLATPSDDDLSFKATYEKESYTFTAKSVRSAKIKASKRFSGYSMEFIRLYDHDGNKLGAKCFDEWL